MFICFRQNMFNHWKKSNYNLSVLLSFKKLFSTELSFKGKQLFLDRDKRNCFTQNDTDIMKHCIFWFFSSLFNFQLFLFIRNAYWNTQIYLILKCLNLHYTVQLKKMHSVYSIFTWTWFFNGTHSCIKLYSHSKCAKL